MPGAGHRQDSRRGGRSALRGLWRVRRRPRHRRASKPIGGRSHEPPAVAPSRRLRVAGASLLLSRPLRLSPWTRPPSSRRRCPPTAWSTASSASATGCTARPSAARCAPRQGAALRARRRGVELLEHRREPVDRSRAMSMPNPRPRLAATARPITTTRTTSPSSRTRT
jgi:hypothetical protein